MKKRVLALLLVLLMALAMFAGCKKEESGTKDDGEESAGFATGAYEVYDEDEELVAWLKVSKKTITVYDEDGNTTEYDYELDEDAGYYLVDDEEAFSIEERKGGLYLITAEDEDEYLLTEIDKADLPEEAEGETAAAAGETPATEAPAAEPTTEALTLSGAYAALEDGEVVGYLDVGRDSMRVYETDGEYEDYDYTIEDGVYNVPDAGMTFVVEEIRGELHMADPEGSSYFVLEAISSSELPTATTPTTTPTSGKTEIAAWGGVTLYATIPDYLPSDWQDDMDYSIESDSSLLTYTLDQNGGTSQLQVVMGAASDVGVTTTEELGELLAAQYESSVGEEGMEQDFITIDGEQWYYMRYIMTEAGVGVGIEIFAVCYGDQVAIAMMMHNGTEASATEALELFYDWAQTFRF